MATLPDLKGSSFTLTVLHLASNDVAEAKSFLTEKVEKAPAFFANAPIVLNIEKVDGDIDFAALKQAVNDAGMIPVGITGSKNKRTQTLATDAGFAVMTASKTPTQAPAEMKAPKVVRTPVRSGQQVYAKDSDLIVLSHVSAGAEVIADGSIHIYGSLRGRAIAGASGQSESKILCHDLQAELVSISGHYWLSDQINSEYWKKKVMLSMADEQLQFEILAQ
ncbi:septum site-determining protein MinC [Vibrio maerlii]|uniref:septum site-determining protein MinC n=1 Tax=Vibrio maerlii TaxID=2231648 RepID=UPI000E3E59D3|nr:septum site-determining protein MinC [Vibrio maerlii]